MSNLPPAPDPTRPAAPQWGAPPQAWAPQGWAPQAWAPGAAYGWGAPPSRPATAGAATARPRWAGTIAVAIIVAGVVLGGIAADNAIPVPSAGHIAISQPVYMTAAPGWVTSKAAGEITDGLALQSSSALLIAQVLSTNYEGDPRQLLQASEASFGADVGRAKKLLEDIAGTEVRGYRAPSFSIGVRKCLRKASASPRKPGARKWNSDHSSPR